MQKNGGNVVSYFMTPQGLVIDAVVGPVNAEKLLAEAKWAVDTYRKAREVGGDDPVGQMQAIALAHMPLGDDPTHAFLAVHPLAPLPAVQQQIFEQLAGQTANQDRRGVALGAAGFALAKQQAKPVLLVLANEDPQAGTWDLATKRLWARLHSRPISPLLRDCEVVVLPIDELSALTSLVQLPDLELAERQAPTMLLIDNDGAQLAAISAHGDPNEVARQISAGVKQFRLDKAIE